MLHGFADYNDSFAAFSLCGERSELKNGSEPKGIDPRGGKVNQIIENKEQIINNS